MEQAPPREAVNARLYNSIASALFLIWGVFIALIAVPLGLLSLSSQGSISRAVGFFLPGLLFCFGAYALRKRRFGVRWWGAALCCISIVYLLSTDSLSFGILINLASLVLIGASWNFQARHPEVTHADGSSN